MTADDTAVLRLPGGDQELPIEAATEGSSALDISKLLSAPATSPSTPASSTPPPASAITYIDGDAGILRYRGYPIEQLAEQLVVPRGRYLLIYGELPTATSSRLHRTDQPAHDAARGPQAVLRRLPARRAPDGGAVVGACRALSTFYQDSLDPFDDEHVELSTIRLLAKLPTIAAYAYKKSVGQPFLYPDNSLGYVENFLRMTFGVPAEDYDVDPVVAKALNLLLILHADHEQNCSTSTVRMVGSSNANLFASISAGINALFGPLHGGANQAVLEMLEDIQARRRRRRRLRPAGQEQGGRRQADGLRPPRLQELRPARGDRQEGRARRARQRSAVDDPLLDLAQCSSRRSRSTTTTSSSASSTRTSTSTPA